MSRVGPSFATGKDWLLAEGTTQIVALLLDHAAIFGAYGSTRYEVRSTRLSTEYFRTVRYGTVPLVLGKIVTCNHKGSHDRTYEYSEMLVTKSQPLPHDASSRDILSLPNCQKPKLRHVSECQ